MRDKRIFKAAELDIYRSGYIVDLSPDGMQDPNCYFVFGRLHTAKEFLAEVDRGKQAHRVYLDMTEREKGKHDGK